MKRRPRGCNRRNPDNASAQSYASMARYRIGRIHRAIRVSDDGGVDEAQNPSRPAIAAATGRGAAAPLKTSYGAGSSILVRGQAVWLGLGPAANLARLGGIRGMVRHSFRRSRGIGTATTARTAPRLCDRHGPAAPVDMLLEGRTTALALWRLMAAGFELSCPFQKP